MTEQSVILIGTLIFMACFCLGYECGRAWDEFKAWLQRNIVVFTVVCQLQRGEVA
jgi:membrane-bound acyltransferase YfiQ involved in biofilm formation